MNVFIKEALHVLDYQNNIVDTIFLSDDSMTPGYAYNITVEESNTGYSNLTFTMPTKILRDERIIGDIKDDARLIDNPKLKYLTPLVKLRYHRQVFYTGDKEIHVQEPVGYGDALVFTDKVYSPEHPNNIIEDYKMDYIVQPTQHKRSGVEVSITYTAIDYPRFNLSKKKMGATINEDTVTKGIWSLYKSEPMSVPGSVQYIKWTERMSEQYGLGIYVPTEWSPATATEFPLNSDQIYSMMEVSQEWPYGLTATVFWWPITSTGRFEGVIYNEGDFLTLNVYPKFETGEVDVSEITYSLDFYGYTWNYLDKGDSYLTPNNPCNYLNWTLETTNWSVATSNAKEYIGTYFDKKDFPATSTANQYLLYQVINEDSKYVGKYDTVASLPTPGADEIGKWAVVSNEEGTFQYRWDGENWYKEESGISKITTYVYTGDFSSDLTWDGQIVDENNFMPFDDNWGLYKITDNFYAGQDLIGSTFYFTDSRGETVYTHVVTEENVTYMDYPEQDTVVIIDNMAALLSFKNLDPGMDGTYVLIYAANPPEEDFIWLSNIVTSPWADHTDKIWTASIDKATGVLYDVDQVETEIVKPDHSVGDLFETVALQCTLSASDSNCYNIITEIAKQFQLYPVFDCEKRTVALKLFVGKNYGLTYRLGYSLENTGVKKDGEKVITKLHCYGGQDNQSGENINLGEAERSYKLYNAGVYKSWASLPEHTDAAWAVVGDMNGEHYWEFDRETETRKVYKYDAEDGLWVSVKPLVTQDGTEHYYVETASGVFDIDLETGMPLPWNPNDPAYIQARSPYGTEYIYNFKWMYDNGWMTKQQILGLYEYNEKIQKLNKSFLEPYTEDFLNTNDAYVNAGVVYSTNQDEFLACLNSMMSSYYRHPGQTTEKFQAFPEAPSDCRLGEAEKGENPDGYYLDIYYCNECGYVTTNEYTTCPKCNHEGTPELHTIHINTWGEEKSSPESTSSEQWNPSSKGFYQNIYDTFEGATHKFYLGKKFQTEAIDNLTEVPSTKTNETKFFIEKVDGSGTDEFYDKSSGLYNWNDYVDKWQEFFGYATKNRKEVEHYQERIEMLEQEFKNYQHDLEILENNIQDEYGDYIIEGKFADSQIVYPAVLFAKSLEASDKFCVPQVTYSLNVIDSGGLIEYRSPCSEIYNELVHTLHNKGQIVPRAGDYVGVYDEQLGLYNVPGLITSIKRTLDKPQSNSITLDTAYTDADDLVGNIISATNTVLNNTDIYARTAVLKADGSIDGAALTKTLEQNTKENISIVGVKGSTLLDSTGLLVSNPSDPNRKMKYSGSGIYGTVDNGASYDLMVGPNGINANYINAGLLDTKSVQIISGLKAKVKLDNLGLSVIDDTSKSYRLPGKDDKDEDEIRDWSKSNLKAFVGVNQDNEAMLYLNGQMVVEEGSKIANWKVLKDKLYSGSDTSYVGLGTSGDYRIWAGNEDPTKAPFSVKADGYTVTSAGSIGGWKVNSTTISQTHTASDKKQYTVTLSNYNNDNADSRVLHCATDGTDTFYILRNGKLYAENADIKGKITATSGTIGGCNISNGTLQIANANISSLNVSKINGGTNSNNIIFNGSITCTNLTATGTINSGSTISGSAINGSDITGGTINIGDGAFNVNSAGGFWIGGTGTQDAAFGVTHNGTVYFGSANYSSRNIYVYGDGGTLGNVLHKCQTYGQTVMNGFELKLDAAHFIKMYFVKGLYVGFAEDE